MKNGKLALMIMTLMLSSTVIFAQGWRDGGRQGYGNGNGNGCYYGGAGSGSCLNLLSDLTEEQKTKITELRENHLEAMDDLRTKRRAAFDPVDKNEIRGEMLKKVQANRKEIRNLLTEDQQKQFDLLQARNNNGYKGNASGRRGGRGACAGRSGRGGRGSGGNW
ncbi:hypothetical protein D1164_06850 [Mariniphaga sediminis]|jgi:Spy/CpxP family protein refolding chaperone|uniref:Periplasmic heavy metal sensor n=1 Tax=Mariniphaga sediminis TaxID=1628158 RepID=A0A399D455_9BACT|nr:Spy/CpxP family protein refolding chaperone [Mariniphaga sediminis]RIH65978.1 hypothetical protein D1164_06850 [Mariniphaga sediminis]